MNVPPNEWLTHVLRRARRFWTSDLGYYGAVASGTSEQGIPIVSQICASDGGGRIFRSKSCVPRRRRAQTR